MFIACNYVFIFMYHNEVGNQFNYVSMLGLRNCLRNLSPNKDRTGPLPRRRSSDTYDEQLVFVKWADSDT